MFLVLLFAVEVELLYHSRGKWIALTICFIIEDDPNKISCNFFALIRNEFGRKMKSICQQGVRGFRYSICCQIREASRIGEEKGIDLSNLPLIYNGKEEYSPNVSHLFNPFDEPLSVHREDFLRMNYWFGQLPASSKSKTEETIWNAQMYRFLCLFSGALPKEINSAGSNSCCRDPSSKSKLGTPCSLFKSRSRCFRRGAVHREVPQSLASVYCGYRGLGARQGIRGNSRYPH